MNGMSVAEMGASLDLRARVLAAAATTPSMTRGQARRLAHALTVLAIAVGLAIFEVVGGVAHGRPRPLENTIRLVDGWALASAAFTWLVLERGRARARPVQRLVGPLVVGLPAVLVAWMVGFAPSEGRAILDWPCLALTCAIALTPLVSYLGLRRGAAPDERVKDGAAAGVGSGAWANVLTLLWCPHSDVHHAILGHALPMLALAAIGAVAARLSLTFPLTKRKLRRRAQDMHRSHRSR